MSQKKNIMPLILGFCVLLVFYGARLFLMKLEENAVIVGVADDDSVKSDLLVSKEQGERSLVKYSSEFVPKHIKFLGRFIFGFDTYAYMHNLRIDKKSIVKQGKLIDQYKIIEVDKTFVVLEKYGQTFKIKLSEDKSEIDLESNKAIVQISEYDRIVNVDKVIESIDNVNDLMKESFYFPEISKGKVVGLKIHRLSDNKVVADSGLVEGDVLKSVNGVKVKGINEIFNLYKSARTADDMQVLIERDGVDQVLNYKFKR